MRVVSFGQRGAWGMARDEGRPGVGAGQLGWHMSSMILSRAQIEISIYEDRCSSGSSSSGSSSSSSGGGGGGGAGSR